MSVRRRARIAPRHTARHRQKLCRSPTIAAAVPPPGATGCPDTSIWFVDLGEVGHLNPASGYGEWRDAERLIGEVIALRAA